MIEGRERQIGQLAWVMAWVGLVVGQLHALARFRYRRRPRTITDLPADRGLGRAGDDLLSPLLDWGDPDLVYVTYGKIWFPVFLAFTLCAVVVYRRRRPAGFERWAWRRRSRCTRRHARGLPDYWTQWTGNYKGDGVEAALFTWHLVNFPASG